MERSRHRAARHGRHVARSQLRQRAVERTTAGALSRAHHGVTPTTARAIRSNVISPKLAIRSNTTASITGRGSPNSTCWRCIASCRTSFATGRTRKHFSIALQATGRRAVLVTNAHRGGLVDQGRTNRADATTRPVVFVTRFLARQKSLPSSGHACTTHFRSIRRVHLLIDDNAAVLAAAQRYGIGQLMTVTPTGLGAAATNRTRVRRVQRFRRDHAVNDSRNDPLRCASIGGCGPRDSTRRVRRRKWRSRVAKCIAADSVRSRPKR